MHGRWPELLEDIHVERVLAQPIRRLVQATGQAWPAAFGCIETSLAKVSYGPLVAWENQGNEQMLLEAGVWQRNASKF